MNLFTVSRESLIDPLTDVSGIVERRHTLPILSNIMLSHANGVLNFLATDLEIQISSTIVINNDNDIFSVTVSAKKLLDICRSLPEGSPISLDNSDDHRMILKAGKSRFNLQTLPSRDFPLFNTPEMGGIKFSLPQKILKKLISRVQYSIAQQDIRYYLNGLLLVLESECVRVVATDGHRLAMAAYPVSVSDNSFEVIIPRKAISELSKLLSDSDELIDVEVYANQLKFSFNNIELITKIVEGKFPDFNKVIPSGHENKFLINRVSLLQALHRASILSNEKFRGVRLVLTQNSLRILCNNSEQEEAQEELEIEYNGDPLDIGFNVGYLLDVLNNISVDQVELSFNDANSSGLITIPGEENFKYVVMPMRI
ncbi:MAG: DNA polymerase III subunit beta [Burkholderiales bacterium]